LYLHDEGSLLQGAKYSGNDTSKYLLI
jgi:hypothetical protein